MFVLPPKEPEPERHGRLMLLQQICSLYLIRLLADSDYFTRFHKHTGDY